KVGGQRRHRRHGRGGALCYRDEESTRSREELNTRALHRERLGARSHAQRQSDADNGVLRSRPELSVRRANQRRVPETVSRSVDRPEVAAHRHESAVMNQPMRQSSPLNFRRLFIWIGRLVLGGVFAYAGVSKLIFPNTHLWPWFVLRFSIVMNLSS